MHVDEKASIKSFPRHLFVLASTHSLLLRNRAFDVGLGKCGIELTPNQYQMMEQALGHGYGVAEVKISLFQRQHLF